MPGVAREQRKAERGFTEHHLFARALHLSPARGLAQGGPGQGSVTAVPPPVSCTAYRCIDTSAGAAAPVPSSEAAARPEPASSSCSISAATTMSWGEVLRDPSAEHEQPRSAGSELDPGELEKVPPRVQRHRFAPLARGCGLVQHDAEPGGGVAEGGHEDWNPLPVRREHHGFRLGEAHIEEATHFGQDLAGRIRARRKPIEDAAHRPVADAQFPLIDIRVVDAVDGQLAQTFVRHHRMLGRAGSHVVPEPQGLEEVLIHHVGARRHHHVHHAGVDQCHQRLLEAGRHERSRQREDDGALPVGEHLRADVRRARQVAGLDGRAPKLLDDRTGVERTDVDVLHRPAKKVASGRIAHAASLC